MVMLASIRKAFGLRQGLSVKVYDGYGDQDDMIIHGHVFKVWPVEKEKLRDNVWANTMQLLRLFMVRPAPKVKVRLEWHGRSYHTRTDQEGFFKFEWKPHTRLEQGWHEVSVHLDDESAKGIKGTGRIYTPFDEQLAFISDIDDTFLISHSANLGKRLYVLFTENAGTRRPFEDVVKHYQALAIGTGRSKHPDPFFYVSSSEWNLYDYIKRFMAVHGLPEGILLLSPLKRLSNVWRTGQGRHSIKFVRIARILSSYPHHRYVLLGDDTQQDPEIYASVVEHFPGKVKAIYIRRVRKDHRNRTERFLAGLKEAGVEVCYFNHSREAIAHSRAIGLIH